MDDVAIHKPVEQPRLSCEPQDGLDAMKIAWRYQNLPKVQVRRWSRQFMLSVMMTVAAYLDNNLQYDKDNAAALLLYSKVQRVSRLMIA